MNGCEKAEVSELMMDPVKAGEEGQCETGCLWW